MTTAAIATGAFLAAVSVAAGAFGAHALDSRLGERELALWETGARYLMYGGLGTMLLGLSSNRLGGATPWPSACVAGGALIFAGTLFAISLGAPRWLGAVTPVGGALMIVGFVLGAWAAFGSG